MKKVEVGSLWWGADGKKFMVLHVIEQEGHTWVHYRKDQKESNDEYSCYIESFLARFTELPK